MSSFNFIGPGYQSQSRNVTCDRLINMYPELVPTGTDASRGTQYALYGTPGRATVATLSDSPGRCIVASGQVADQSAPAGTNYPYYAVSGSTLYKVDNRHNATAIGSVGNELIAGLPAKPAQIIVIDTDTLAVRSAGQLYVVTVSTNTITNVTTPLDYISSMTWMDGRLIICGVYNGSPSNRFYISDLQTPDTAGTLVFDELNFATKEAHPDPILGVMSAYEQLILFGSQSTEIWFDNGAADFPFQRIAGGGVIECGLSYWAETLGKMDNTIIWLGIDERGAGVVWELRGLIPVRVSNHYIENMIRDFSLQYAIGHTYQEAGHWFYVLTFPLDGETLVYDSTTGMWHERLFWSGSAWQVDKWRFHAYVPGMSHLVQDYSSGKIALQDLTLTKDDTSVIRRMRVAPHISNERFRTFFSRLELHMQQGLQGLTGINPLTYSSGTSPNPIISMRYSDDGGYTWSSSYDVAAGSTGQYGWRVIWNRLGSGRDRVFEVSTSEPIPMAWVDAYLQAEPGNGT